MELDKNKFALAVSGTLGIISVICAAVVSVAPDLAAKIFGSIAHLANIKPAEITLVGFVVGLAQVLVYSYIGGYIFASLHNRFLKSK
jgi:hypothetical protein